MGEKKKNHKGVRFKGEKLTTYAVIFATGNEHNFVNTLIGPTSSRMLVYSAKSSVRWRRFKVLTLQEWFVVLLCSHGL